MNSYVHEVVRHLMELSSLEIRLATMKRDGEQTGSITALIESLRGNLPVEVLIGHDRMRSHGRYSVAEVRRGVCAGCHIALGIGNVAAVRRGELRNCGNCGRFLYIVEDERRTQAPAVSTPAPNGRPAPGAVSASGRPRGRAAASV